MPQGFEHVLSALLTIGVVAVVFARLCVLPLAAANPLASGAQGQQGRAFGSHRRLFQRANELAFVPASEGWIIPANSSEDGSGSLAFNDRIPTGMPVADLVTQPTPEDCFRACRSTPKCNAWAYCALEAGCDRGSTFGNVTALAYHACMLLEQGLSAPETGRPVVAIDAPGFIGGAPITATGTPIEGYELLLGRGFFNRYDFNCSGTLTTGQCMLRGTPQELAPRCDADPLCRIMVWLPSGWDYLGPPLSDLKGAPGLVVTAADATLNQNAAAYLKLVPPPSGASSSSSLSGGAIAGLVAGVCVAAVAAVASFLLVRRWKRRKLGSLATAPSGTKTVGISKVPADEAKPGCTNHGHDTAQQGQERQQKGGAVGEAAGPMLSWVAAQQDDAQAYADQTPGPKVPPWAVSLKVPPSKPSSTREGGVSGASAARQGSLASSEGLGHPGSAPVLPATRKGSGGMDTARGSISGGAGSTEPVSIGEAGEEAPPSGSNASTKGPHFGPQPSSEAGLEALLAMGSAELGWSGSPLSSELSSDLSSLASPQPNQLLLRMPEVHWKDWVVAFEAIDFCQKPDGSYHELGTGGFGIVYKVLLDGVQPYAAKVIDLGSAPEVQSIFLREAAVLRRLRHRNIVGFRGVCVSEGKGILLMELMEGGDLFSKITLVSKNTRERPFGWHARGKRVALDVARGIHYLHSLHLTHFDIKANNVLLTRDLTAKIADVGFTRLMSNTHHSIKDGRTGTFAYMAPELLMGRPCTESVDIWSYGLVLWEICTGERPMRGRNRPLRVPEDCPQEVADLYEHCIAEGPADRPSARELVERLTALVVPPGAPDRR